ncbi:hypothetical protein EVAR_69135_1 [Eumeta japonica]|uniref:Uncharacterized protein n=1 Tax=Eumeta variegata TaxID=151549 RepID=A0A4C1SF95_EUMVA|nr:hypothetical protein EVAR_69135_1 [Eumeta japonica]
MLYTHAFSYAPTHKHTNTHTHAQTHLTSDPGTVQIKMGCPFHPILETSHSGKSRNGKEELTFLCDVFTLGATAVSSTTAGRRCSPLPVDSHNPLNRHCVAGLLGRKEMSNKEWNGLM